MNGKQAKKIRRLLRMQPVATEYKFVTTPGILRNGTFVVGLQWKFTYITSDKRALYKMAKKMSKLVDK